MRPTCDAGRVDAAPGDRGVGAGQVDVLEQAALGRRRRRSGSAADAVLVDGDQLARLDLADEAGADDVERGGLARDDPAALEPAEHQRAHAVRVAGGVQGVLVHEDEAERALSVGSTSSAAASTGDGRALAASSVVIRSESVVAPIAPARGSSVVDPARRARWCW